MLRVSAVMMLALAWALLTSHCRLEALAGFEFLRCTSADHEPAECGDPCGDSGCCAVETASYHAQRPQQSGSLLPPELIPVVDFRADRFDPPLPIEVLKQVLAAPPPERLSSWRFAFRAALPPRAPSVVSS